MDANNENRLNAEIAFSNRNYNDALIWYQKALEDEPNDLYLLSRLGSICVPLGKFDLALQYFGKAKELNPENGDNFFNYANACFFNKDNAGAFESYVEAEKRGCSDDIMPRLYYQLAMICSMRMKIDPAQNIEQKRKDAEPTLTYFQKCQDIDRNGTFCISPDFISEKLKIYMYIEDYENAERCAALLLASDPATLKNYMLYYSILMAHKKFDEASKVLGDANEYANINSAERNSLTLQNAALYMAIGEGDKNKSKEYCEKAEKLLAQKIDSGELSYNEKVDFSIALSEIMMKSEKYDASIKTLQGLIDGSGKVACTVLDDTITIDDSELTEEEIEKMINSDVELIQDLISSGELDGDMVDDAAIDYDENWNEIRKYEKDTFAKVDKARAAKERSNSKTIRNNKNIPVEMQSMTSENREKAYFLLLSCYMSKDKFSAAEKYASFLNGSSNKYYDYYGKYSSALIARKTKKPAKNIDEIYSRTIAFFRNKSFSDPGDNLANIFRARLYAEEGKYEKALELSNLMNETDRAVIEEYISECRK